MDKKQISGYIMAGVGLAMLFLNALSYILGWDIKNSAFTVLGLIFVGVGLKTARRKSTINSSNANQAKSQ